MPYSEKQERLFQMIAHGGKATKTKTSLTAAKASELLEHSRRGHEYGKMMKARKEK
jgi:hypothetical protein